MEGRWNSRTVEVLLVLLILLNILKKENQAKTSKLYFKLSIETQELSMTM